MAGKKIFYKAQDDVLDFFFDFKPYSHSQPGAVSDWLASGETISSFTVEADGGIVVDSSSELDGTVTVWLSGGETGTHKVYCEIVTSEGRTAGRYMWVRVE